RGKFLPLPLKAPFEGHINFRIRFLFILHLSSLGITQHIAFSIKIIVVLDVQNPMGIASPQHIGSCEDALFIKVIIQTRPDVVVEAFYGSVILLSEQQGTVPIMHLLIECTVKRKPAM